MGKPVLHTVPDFAPTTKINVPKPQLSSSCVSQGYARATTRASNIPLMAEPRQKPHTAPIRNLLGERSRRQQGGHSGSRSCFFPPQSIPGITSAHQHHSLGKPLHVSSHFIFKKKGVIFKTKSKEEGLPVCSSTPENWEFIPRGILLCYVDATEQALQNSVPSAAANLLL